MTNEAFVVKLDRRDGSGTTLWSGPPGLRYSVNHFIDVGVIVEPGTYMLAVFVVSQRVLIMDIFTVVYNDHGELVAKYGFLLLDVPHIDPRRIHKWPH